MSGSLITAYDRDKASRRHSARRRLKSLAVTTAALGFALSAFGFMAMRLMG